MKPSGIIILAAGSSSRLGYSKQLIKYKGKNLLSHAIECATALTDVKVCVVLGARASEHQQYIDTSSAETVVNDDWQKGIGSSIKVGVQFLLDERRPDNITLMACDQPFLTTAHLAALLKEHEQSKMPIVASAYADTVGIPCLFHASVFDELLALEDEAGAKKVITRDSSRISVVRFVKGEIDIDTDDDVKKWLPSE